MIQIKNSGNNSATFNFKPDLFSGIYIGKGGGHWLNQDTDIHIKVCQRKTPNPKTPMQYIVMVTPDKQYPYISSLYPTDQANVFTIEYKRYYFTVSVGSELLSIIPKK